MSTRNRLWASDNPCSLCPRQLCQNESYDPKSDPAENRTLIVVTENGIATCGILSLGPTIEVGNAQIVRTGSVFEALTTGFRLFVWEFSINERFDAGPRTTTISSLNALLTLTQLDAENVGRAVRDLPFAYMRVRGVTATNQTGTSIPVRLRR